MKSILLTTTAIVAFAGAAVADGHAGVSFGGDFTLGFNDDNDDDNAVIIGDNDGFYWEGDLNVTGTAALDNGVTASATWEFDIVDEANQQTTQADLALLSLTTDNAGLYVGETEFAALSQWKSAGDMEADGFSENDGENVIRGDVSVAGFDASVSYVLTHALGNIAGTKGAVDALVADPTVYPASLQPYLDNSEEVDQLSIGVSGDVGMFSMSVAYQEESVSAGLSAAAAAELALLPDDATRDAFVAAAVADGVYAPGIANGDFNESEIFGISGGVAVAGADITLAYASNETAGTTSTGIQVSYPFGPVTATGYYVVEEGGANEDPNFGATIAYADGPISVTLDYDDDQGIQKVGLDGTFDLGNGFTLGAGVYNESDERDVATGANDGTDYYVAGMYDLGGGAEVLVTYAEAEVAGNIADDEIGGPDYQVGTTVQVSFSF